MEICMNRSILVCAPICAVLLASTIAAPASLLAQQAGQNDQYQGTSAPPPNDTIVSDPPVEATQAPALTAKPSPAHYDAEPSQQAPALTRQMQAQSQDPVASNSASTSASDGGDSGIVQIAPDPARPALGQRVSADPDGDIVHPAPLGPNELGERTVIRVRLITAVSTAFSQEGETFKSRVASDVVQDGHVLIPVDSEI